MDHINKIAVYDFDKTLAKTPENTVNNRLLWEKYHNIPWPHRGNSWWAKIESLDTNVFDVELNEHVKNSAILDINALDVHAVVLTGRIAIFSTNVKEICRKGGLPIFDGYHFNNSHETLKFKLTMLNQLKISYPKAKFFEMWEDREEHIPHFIEWGKINYGENFTMNVVK